MGNKVVVFGAGLVGKAIAIDLSKHHRVTSVDIDKKPLDYLSSCYNIETIGFTATANAKMILEGIFNDSGVFPLEFIGAENECFNYIMNYQKNKNIDYKLSESNS